MNTFEASTLRKYKEILKTRNYGVRTIEHYASVLRIINNEIGKDLYHCNNKDIREYMISRKWTSVSQQNQFISAIKLFYRYIVRKEIENILLERPRAEQHLPRVIHKEELIQKINNIYNLKHKAILSLGFSVGLRVSEVCNLKIVDIDSKRMLITIKNGKGMKDRIVPLTQQVLNLLRLYFREYKPSEYLFQGQFGGKYSTGSCEKLVKKYIDSEAGFHLLRHSSFTSMLENGTDIRIIQKIAGHKNSKTTEIYTHVSAECLRKAAMPI